MNNKNYNFNPNDPFNKIIIDMAILHDKKNQDYGNAFGQLFNEYGLNLSIMHLHEKLNRIKSVHKNNSANNESIKDSLIDMANYAIMTIVELNNQELQNNDINKTNDTKRIINDIINAIPDDNNNTTNPYGFPDGYNI